MGKYFPPTAAEIHAAGLGALDGIQYGKRKYDRLKKARGQVEDVDKEPHYYVAGYTVANRGKWYVTGAATGQTALQVLMGVPKWLSGII